MSNLEQRVSEIGDDLFTRMTGNAPGVFNKAWWSGQVLEWSMKDPEFKTEMFRFVDVFPVLNSAEEVHRHIQEYLLRPGLRVPAVIKMALKGAGLGKLAMKMATGQISKNLGGMAKNFIAGEDGLSAVPKLKAMRKDGYAFTVDLLGEATVSEHETEQYVEYYLQLIDELATACESWAPDPQIDEDDIGPIPRANISIKVSAMYSQLDPIAFESSVARATERLLPLFQKAKARNVFLNLDMEQHDLKDLTLGVFKRVLSHPSLDGFEHAGVVIQTYHRQAEQDLSGLIDWARSVGKRVTVRLVKGAYWDYETVRAAQNGWACPLWLDKADSDACFERCTEVMLKNHDAIRSAIGSHNVRSIAHALAIAEAYNVPNRGFEIQCLYGMAEPIKAACAERGLRVRVYTPVGELIPGMAYLVRRLLENTSNESWLRQGFADGVSQEELLQRPEANGRDGQLTPRPKEKTDASDPGPFINEPLRDFTNSNAREQFRLALERLNTTLGDTYGPVINGAMLETHDIVVRHDPADESTVIGRVHFARIEDADQAIECAHTAFDSWRLTPAKERAQRVFELAAIMRSQRDTLSALMVREVGKPWREADADTAEAVDFCEYYAREMLRLSLPQPMQNIPGEVNLLTYAPRGVCAVIAPWNFPLAILTGMTMAAAVSGNTVVMKPAEQSSVIAAHFMKMVKMAGFPPGVIQYLPGRGEVVGEYLVNHPNVANITFTGSREVGLHIWAQAGQTRPGQRQLKRVVCEMGGKNAIIVDSDADVDEAVLGVIHSAFAFSGQKCSACSRVIVLEDNYDAFVSRLVEAARSLDVRPPIHPESALGPVIDKTAYHQLLTVISDAEARGQIPLLKHSDVPRTGYFVGPTIFGDVPEHDRLAQDEFFGPIIAIIKASDFNDALRIFNGTAYALTGGIFSRSPSRIEHARQAMDVGNLYINRSITGAIVGRQPFGGSRMSGGGTKAGGPDYLLNFLDGRTSTENTLRRGFTPESV